MIRPSLKFAKADIRKKMYDQRKSLTKLLRLKNSYLISKRLEGLESYRKAKGVLFFMSLEEEIQTWKMIVKTFKLGKRVYLPIIDKERKEIKITNLDNLDIEFVKKNYGVKEPHHTFLKFASNGMIDLVLVPGLAFDLNGGRIGFGAGYYDRFLKKLDGGIDAVGLAFDFQIMKAVPQTLWDQKVCMVITEKRTLCSNQSPC